MYQRCQCFLEHQEESFLLKSYQPPQRLTFCHARILRKQQVRILASFQGILVCENCELYAGRVVSLFGAIATGAKVQRSSCCKAVKTLIQLLLSTILSRARNLEQLVLMNSTVAVSLCAQGHKQNRGLLYFFRREQQPTHYRGGLDQCVYIYSESYYARELLIKSSDSI